jgi:glycerophosphoryl diester phosphodiesterase
MLDLPSTTLILGHRGAPREATENTLRSFQLAVGQGADGVELDVQRSRDGVPVVVHDESLDRTTAATGHVADLPWPAIQRLTGALVPDLEQACAWAAASGAWLNVELKAAGVEEEVVRRIRSAGLGPRAILSSFHPEILARLGDVGGELRRYLLTESWDPEAAAAAARVGAAGVCLKDDAASPAALQDLVRLGHATVVWTVNDPARVLALLEARVYAIITDLPGMAVAVRDRWTAGSGSTLAGPRSD